MVHTDEKALNAALAKALEDRHPRWEVNAEQSGVLRGESAKRPDIVITPKGARAGAPVVIETEYHPGATVERDAASRLGFELTGSYHAIDKVIAVRMPRRLGAVSIGTLPEEIAAAEFEYVLLRSPVEESTAGKPSVVDEGEPVRFPIDGWITGTVDDLAGFCEQIALNEHLLDRAVSLLEGTVYAVASGLRIDLESERRPVLEAMAMTLHQTDSLQTTVMGVTIIADALLFQTAIAGADTLDDDPMVPTPQPGDSRFATLEAWDRILEINYWPIFATARKLLAVIPDGEAKLMIRSLTPMISELAGYGVTSTGDMVGQMFGRLIADRKFLATFYTRPASAHLLAELAVARLGADWADREQVTALRVADLACGTGTLLTAAYQRIMVRVRRAGSVDDSELHATMIERALIGADIMPAAVHLTATLLSSTYPAVPFTGTGVHLMPYGAARGVGVGVEIGSLELLDDEFETPLDLFDSGREMIGGRGNRRTQRVLDHGAADLVIMNPPFTRSTNHEAAAAGVPLPSFAGFDTAEDEQYAMSQRLTTLSAGVESGAGHGNAGLGSYFVDVAHAKVKPGGTIAFVLPFAVVSGDAWEPTRVLLAAHYRDICVVSIAATGSTDRAFSADTGMAEALIVATRCRPGEQPGADDVLYVNLHKRPADLVEAVETARLIVKTAFPTSLDDNSLDDKKCTSRQEKVPSRREKSPSRREIPESGSLDAGRVGNFARGGIDDGGCAGIGESDLAMCALRLGKGRLWLRRLGDIEGIRLTDLGELGERGPVDRDINGYAGRPIASSPRGPFDIEPSTDWRAVTYPVLWAHDAEREQRLIVDPDTQGRVRPGCDENARRIWATASRLHFNRDFRLNSQSLAACFTPVPAIGGRAWPTFKPAEDRWTKALLLWANTTLGLISFWWTGTRQQQGRSNLTVKRLPRLTVLDPRILTGKQLATVDDKFESFAGEDFLPANEAYRDETRRRLDEFVLIELLGLDPEVMSSLAVLRDQWCREPSVHGGKRTRPDGSS